MKKIDKFIIDWCHQNNIDEETYIDTFGLPSEFSPEPYMEELPYILDYGEDDIESLNGKELPLELTQYRLAKWASNKQIPLTYPLVQDRKKWRNVALDMEFDLAEVEDVTLLLRLVQNIARGKLLKSLADIDEVFDDLTGPDITGQTYVIPSIRHMMIVGDKAVVFKSLDEDSDIKIYDYDGNRLHKDANTNKIERYLMVSMKMSQRVSTKDELASLIGNHLADLVLGTNSISILELP